MAKKKKPDEQQPVQPAEQPAAAVAVIEQPEPVANGNGSLPADTQVPSGDGVQFVSSYFQGAVYATNIIEIGTTATVDGPLDGSTVILGQSSTSTFNGYTFVPVGMPGNPTIFALAQTPQVTGG